MRNAVEIPEYSRSRAVAGDGHATALNSAETATQSRRSIYVAASGKAEINARKFALAEEEAQMEVALISRRR